MQWQYNFPSPLVLVMSLPWEVYFVIKEFDVHIILLSYVQTFSLPCVSHASCNFSIPSFVKLAAIMIFLPCRDFFDTKQLSPYIVPYKFKYFWSCYTIIPELPILWVLNKSSMLTLREKYPYSEFFWSVFSRIRTECGPEKLQIRTLFTQC